MGNFRLATERRCSLRQYPRRQDLGIGRSSANWNGLPEAGMIAPALSGALFERFIGGVSNMRLTAGLGAIIFCVSHLCWASAGDPTVIVRSQMLIDGVSAEPRRNQDIVIRGNRIVAVTAAGAHSVPPDAQVIDL
jgi:hypothetical protein